MGGIIMNDIQNNQKIPSQEKPILPDNTSVSRTNNIIWQLTAVLCFSSGIISCLPLANNLFRLLIDNFLLFLLFEGLFLIPCALIAIGIGFGALKIPFKNQKYWHFFIAGMVLGLIGLVSIPLIFPSYREEFRKFSCASNIQSIGLALRMYSQEYKEQFPDRTGAKGLEMLRSGGYLENVKMFTCPSVSRPFLEYEHEITEETTDYVYVGGFKEGDPVDTPIMYDKEKNHSKGYRNVLFIDGTVGRGSGLGWLEEARTNVYHKFPFLAWTKKDKTEKK